MSAVPLPSEWPPEVKRRLVAALLARYFAPHGTERGWLDLLRSTYAGQGRHPMALTVAEAWEALQADLNKPMPDYDHIPAPVRVPLRSDRRGDSSRGPGQGFRADSVGGTTDDGSFCAPGG